MAFNADTQQEVERAIQLLSIHPRGRMCDSVRTNILLKSLYTKSSSCPFAPPRPADEVVVAAEEKKGGGEVEGCLE